MKTIALRLAALAAAFLALAAPVAAAPQHGIAMHGAPALPADFDHFAYANPDAPKGGRVTYAFTGTFDSLNPFIVKSATTTARGIWDVSLGNNVFESLLVRGRDEPFTLYGLVAQTVETPDDRSFVEFTIDPRARFSDGAPITPADVIFSLEILRDKGRPIYRSWYSKVVKSETVGERGVRFTFADGSDRELPLLLGLMPILPKHAIDPATFDQSTLKPMIGSGPYVIAAVSPGKSVTYRRNPDYWAKDLPVKRGFDNFDEIKVDYYTDRNAMFEAFKKGLYDVNPEVDPTSWETGYDFPAVADGRVVKESFKTGLPKGMNGFALNTRRKALSDVRVREALAMLFDFEWINKTLYFGVYARNASFFEDSELSSVGRPASAGERALLAAFPGAVEPDVMDGSYRPTVADGSGGDRKVMRAALDLLGAAGYALKGNALVETATGTPLGFEILVQARDQERLALAWQRTLRRVGIAATVRLVDATQYQRRVASFDFDIIQTAWPASLSPGNEQGNRWASSAAGIEGSFNYVGAHEPAIDAMIAALLAARDRPDFVDAVRALDRVLISQHYVVPLFYLPDVWVARWTRIARPQTSALQGYTLSTWWSTEAAR
ncbi:peptide/nickel transport system substrate-binding protein [Prosthecomicrobium pneumaticum]|uniref:Peptide/nickel transport system substrate-binding protein n=2 Tax=Prosthecomicrobium pneumaticum TaxID=81895 RepID=A0A7W9CSI7_9HYPH|nr:peptide/nickel transport system substrate-binding protein [Prosthecomicrobium pneumaticum]